jgi:replicative DNA helicase
MSTVGRKLLSAILKKNDPAAWVKLGVSEDLFKDSEKVLFTFMHDHVLKFGKLPAPETVVENLGDVLLDVPEPPEFYLEQAERRHLHNSLKMMIIQTQDLLKFEETEKAFEAVSSGMASLFRHRHRNSIIDFRHIEELIWVEYKKAASMADDAGIFFGWPTLDNMTGGLQPGDFAAIVGRPQRGKTFMALYSAMHSWSDNRTPLFVSMEMTKAIIAKRMAAMHTKKNLTQLLKGAMSTKAFTSMMAMLEKLHDQPLPLWVVDGNFTATVDQIAMRCQELHPSCVWVDGAYLLGHPDKRMKRFERITENAESLKSRIATDLETPVIATYQFGRSVVDSGKSKGKEVKAGLEHIYGTDAIGQIASLVLGLLEDETIETEQKRSVEILKGRSGETGKFAINWDFSYMDFSEVKDQKPEELQFLM